MSTPLKTIRLLKNLSTYQVAVAVGVQQPTINRVENARMRPSPKLTIALADFFGEGITRDEIMFPEFHPNEKKPVRRAQLQEAR